jgi:hypothetical protein
MSVTDGCATEPEQTKLWEDLYQNAGEDDKAMLLTSKATSVLEKDSAF